MRVLPIHPEKHLHPRRYRRATGLLVAGVGLGILMLLVGLWLLYENPAGWLLWVTSLILIGPSLVFLSAVGYSTYLENLETRDYGAVYERAPSFMDGPAHH